MTVRDPDGARRPLADLLAYIAGPARTQGDRTMGDAAAGDDAAAMLRKSYPELPVLDEFKTRWIQLSANRQLERAQEQVPDNAGPLHSSRLVTRSLALMHELSPDYLHKFMAYVDALSWTEQLLANIGSGQDAARTSGKAGAKDGAKASAKPRARKSAAP